MIYYAVVNSIWYSENFNRDAMLFCDYAFTKDPETGHWKFLKYRFTKEGFNTQFFDIQSLLDYVYKDLIIAFHSFDKEKMKHLRKLPGYELSIPINAQENPINTVVREWRQLLDTYRVNYNL